MGDELLDRRARAGETEHAKKTAAGGDRCPSNRAKEEPSTQNDTRTGAHKSDTKDLFVRFCVLHFYAFLCWSLCFSSL
jgi:hypothetical protein